MSSRSIKLSAVAELIPIGYQGNDITLDSLGLCNRRSEFTSVLSYIESADFLSKAIENTAVKALVVTQQVYEVAPKDRFSFIITEYPEELFYRIHDLLYSHTDFYALSEYKQLVGCDCDIHPTAIIENNVIVGDNVIIGAHTLVRRNTVIGDDAVIGNNTIIGSEGFQVLRDHNGVPFCARHVGGTLIGNGVRIGDHVTIANSLFDGTVVIGDHTVIDNFCYIAHNCKIGKNCIITASVRIMGSSEVKNNVYIAPNAVILNKVIINEGAFIGTCAMVNKDVCAGETVMGIPAEPQESYIYIRKLIKSLKK